MIEINYFGYYFQFDGYGRYSSRVIEALRKSDVYVYKYDMDYIHNISYINLDNISISGMPPYMVNKVEGRHWLLTMVEGTVVPKEWIDNIHKCNIERLIVPCEHNRVAYLESGCRVPVHVVHGGTDPDEFPVLKERPDRPYTFLALGDRGLRKGWEDVHKAFYLAFGGKTFGKKDVRIIYKYRDIGMPTVYNIMKKAEGADKRILFDGRDAESIYDVFSQADCIAIPSRCEGWGMPHREAACMGLPVITQQYSGLDDGNTWQWSLPVTGSLQDIPLENTICLGKWQVADVDALAKMMSACYTYQDGFAGSAKIAARWIRENQTWQHTALGIKRLLYTYG